ncbi:MAG: helix-turn-helix transcriptional regulator, partial [Candidatus Symbiothrix sp.]|nr:helix-turn-helix transcriptional regulator [Candidatus Symbiothrix sp.]
KEQDVVHKSIQYMKDNLENKITSNDIASHAGYSEARFNSLFSQKTSYSPMAYYNQLKIQRACSYLQFSEMKIKEIAFRLQFYDQFHFSKTFRQEIGMTPKEYRKMHRDDRQSFGV